MLAVRAQVLQYRGQTNSWAPLDGGLSRVDVYRMAEPELRYRVVAVAAQTKDVVLNMPLYREVRSRELSRVFRCLATYNGTYGLNFATPEEATDFGKAVDEALAAMAPLAVAPAPVGCYDTQYARILSSPVTGLLAHAHKQTNKQATAARNGHEQQQTFCRRRWPSRASTSRGRCWSQSTP